MIEMIVLSAALAATCLSLSASDGVWKDALLRIRGAVDRNGDGLWTPTDYANPDAVEIPDPMRRVGIAQKISYNMTRHADSDVRIVEREVRLGAEGRTVTRPVLYFPQPHFVDGGVNKARLQALKLFNGGSPLTNDQWTAVFRLKPDDVYMLQKKTSTGAPATSASCWFFRFPVGGTRGEMRLGLRTENANASGFVTLCTGNTTNNKKMDLLLTNACDWAEISISVDRRQVRLSCGQPGRLRRWTNHTILPATSDSNAPVGPIQPTSFLLGDTSRNSVESCDNGNADGFRGYVETVGIWNRVLTDAEIVEAFGGPGASVFRLGEEGASAGQFDGAQATGVVTLDPLAHDQRSWPVSYGAGARISIPFNVDASRAGLAQALRFVPREGSSAGRFAVKLDDVDLGVMRAYARRAGAAAEPSFLFVPAGRLAAGDHVLTLTVAGTAGAIRPDVLELTGSWGVGDGSGTDVSYDSDTRYGSTAQRGWADIYYASSRNTKDFAWYMGSPATTERRDKIVYWNVPDGLAARATFKLKYKLINGSANISGRKIVTWINGAAVNERAAGNVTHEFDIPSGALHDGLNEIRCGFDTLANGIWLNPVIFQVGMQACESDNKFGLMVLVR